MPAKKSASKKAPVNKTTSTKATVKKSAVKKTVVKNAPIKKATPAKTAKAVKKSASAKAPAKKVTTKHGAAASSPASTKVKKVVKSALKYIRGSSKVSASLSLFLSQFDSTSPMPKAAGGFAARALSLPKAAGEAAVEAALEPTVNLLVRCDSNAPASAADGAPVLRGSGTVRTVLTPVSEIEQLVARPDIRRISAPRKLRPLMDLAKPATGVPAFRIHADTSSSGKRVIIGIVDTGIDSGHKAFKGRILAIWDQSLQAPQGNHGGPAYGRVLRPDGQGAANKLGASIDDHGHGTHVAGIAAGQGGPYEGVAPEAELLIVKTNFLNSGILDGVRWIFQEATARNRAAVVNLSLGGHGDGHDGTDDLSIGLNEECGPGKLVVAAAGNEGGDSIHAMQRVTATNTASFRFDVAPQSGPNRVPWITLNGWYEGTGICEVRITGSNGVSTGWQGLLPADGAASSGSASYTIGKDEVTISTPDTDNPNQDRQFLINIEPTGFIKAVQGGQWTLEVRRSSGTPGHVHVWILIDGNLPPIAAQFASGIAAASHLIGSPGSATEVITVASFTTRNAWRDINNHPQTVGMPLNTISPFSSPGPRRDGVLKPDVAAPGAMIVSCLSSVAQEEDRFKINDEYCAMPGTSMASPLIAGVIALLLERNPNLTPAQAKAFLKGKSSVPGLAVGSHDPKWGYGLLKL